ncbi:MAG: choice-of-anchor V domain-containing protein [Flavobacteriia bacterium]
MKNTYFFFSLAIGVACVMSFQSTNLIEIEQYLPKSGHLKNGGGAGPGKTGATGEGNCTSCHSGATQDGSNENILTVTNGASVVTEYVPGSSYTVSLTMLSNPSKKGFQATALTSAGVMAGNFTAGTNTSVNGSAKKYANHTSSSNTSAVSSWNWSWTAPATDEGDVTFFVASNKANNNGGTGGDVIYLSQHTLSAASTAGIKETKEMNPFSARYSSESNQLIVNFESLTSELTSINIVDMSGRSVYFMESGVSQIGENTEKLTLPTEIKSGVYVVHLFLNNRAMSSKVFIQR